MKQRTITICVASDNHYAILIVALLKSIDVNHHSGEHIDFYIIDDGIATDFPAKLAEIVDPARITIKWIKSKEVVPQNISIPSDSSAFPLTAYMRVFSPFAISEEVEKLIYLDVDILVQDDISKLWNTDLGDYIVAAAQDSGKTVSCAWAGIPNYKELGLAADTKYFNSGVLIINPKRWRDENIALEVMNTLIKHRAHVQLADQYGLNVVLVNRWLQLDQKWNWFAFMEDEKPYIIHFLDIKPIFKSYHSQEVYKKEFYRYLSMTPWSGYKPQSDYKRLIRKFFNKLKKVIKRL